MAQAKGKSALIIGAGLAGSLLAVYLARQGWRVRVVERRPDPRVKGYVGGRSINLALSVRGLWGLAGVGMDEKVMRQDAIAMRGRVLHPVKGETAFQPYSKDPNEGINSVSRGGLNLTLLHAAAAEPGVELVFNQRCVDVDPERGVAMFVDEGTAGVGVGAGVVVTQPVREMEADLILGADGAFSAVRTRLQRMDRFEYSQSYLGHGYKELHIPAARGGGVGKSAEGGHGTAGGLDRSLFAMEPNALHIWPRGGSMMIALPNRDGSFTCTLFWPFEGEHSFAALKGDAEVRAFFGAQYGDAVPLMPTLAEDFARNPVSSLVTVRCWPWTHVSERGKGVAVLGDAAHAIVPFYGQGMNCAFEDVRVLAEMLGRDGGGDLRGVLQSFERARKPNADAIAEMALENFVEMRDKVGQAAFRYKKRVEQAVHEMYPGRVTPQYNLVSFSTVPYAEAQRRGQEFDVVLERIVSRVPMERGGAMEEAAWKGAVREAAEVELRAAGM